ncbi:hypothetical protein CSV86_014890 [Pseudomonas putida CSV86]|uniref:Uncharacterized protein n=1 Tax=Pseudomonas bharatica CSV86 TaxID=1005395 RepID=L1M513_9PSED|nr:MULTISPECIES: hypothetical protein [Pseudomonas]MDG9886298.1 hypothetical protein [Pseudomonas sp. GD04058]NNJ16413.1 hypothetical protein [Pseudomonas bharatica CSV86]
MSATTRFHETANDALVEISRHLPPGAKLALVIYTAGSPELDIVLKDQGLDPDEVVGTLRRRGGLSLDGDNAYKSSLCDVIVGSLACGKQNNNPPPAGHWCEQFWEIGRAEGEQQAHLLAELTQARDQRDALLSAAVEALSVIERIKPAGNGNGTQVRLAAAIDKAKA